MSVEGIAAWLQREDAPPLCLLPDAALAAQIKRALPGARRLPTILPISQLLAAAAHLPLDERLPETAALLSAPARAGDALPWQMLAALRPYCANVSAAARLQLAKKLAALFAEVDSYVPQAAAENPFAAFKQGGSHEMGVAAAMWELFADEALHIQPTLRALTSVLPPFLAVCDAHTTPVQRAFYAQQAAEVVAVQPSPQQAVWQSAFTLDGEMPATCAHQAYEAAGETLSQTAQLALQALQEFLLQNKEEAAAQEIGVVVYDRLLARRLRAMAEAADILIADRAGWRAETLSYGAALAHSAAVLLDDFSLMAVQQVLQVPFYAQEKKSLPRAAAAWRQWLGEALHLPSDAEALQQQCARRVQHAASEDSDDAYLLPLLQAQAQARAQVAGTMQPPVQWLDWLEGATAQLCAAWRADSVAEQLRAQLRQRAGAVTVSLSAAEFLLWLEDALVEERVSEDEVNSTVVFVQPGSTRCFDALLLLGCSGNLPGEAQGWLGEAERDALHLPTPAQRLARERMEISCHLAQHRQVAAVWCAVDASGNPQSPHPFWSLFAAHCRAHQCLHSIALPALPEPVTALPQRRAASWQRVKMPEKLFLSAAEMALKCPYLFYSQYGLRLQDEEWVQVNEVSPLLAGKLLHQALRDFAEASGTLQGEAALQQCWQEVVAQTLRGNRPGLALLRQYWHEQSAYLAVWEQQRRDDGWRIDRVEHRVTARLSLADAEIELSGRIDRLDVAADGTLAVVDYKSGSKPSKSELVQGELPQLPLYAFLMEMEGATVHEQLLCRPHRDGQWQAHGVVSPRRVAAHWRRVLHEVAAGAALPANGTLAGACAQCVAAGLCRREHWRT